MLERIEAEAFFTLAQELHFGRTAERLNVTTAQISRTIKKLERRIGTTLFERTSRRVRLTAAGQELHDDLRPAYDQIQAGLTKAIDAAHGVRGVLRVGFLGAAAGQLVIQAGHLFNRRHPDHRVSSKEVQADDALERLRGGDVDLAIISLPHHEPDMITGPVLFSEPRVLAVPAGHRLARQDTASLEDLAAVRLLQVGDAFTDYWREERVPRQTPAGAPIEPGPHASTQQEALALIGAGEGAFILGAQVTRFYVRPDVAYIPLTDTPPLDWIPTWLTSNDTPQIRAFVRAAQEAAARVYLNSRR